MAQRKYLLDENVNPRLRKALKQHSSEMIVWRVGDVGVPPRGTSDPDILLWCEANSFSLVTNNRASMPVHLKDHLMKGQHILGIFILKDGMSLRETVEELTLIWEATELEEYADLLNFLPVSE
jgi:hypothetical protein